MGFGFGNEQDEEEVKTTKEIKHNYFDTLKFKPWDKLECGQEVQSVLTGMSGVITKVDEKYFLIEIDWKNGKNSRASKNDLSKVIVL